MNEIMNTANPHGKRYGLKKRTTVGHSSCMGDRDLLQHAGGLQQGSSNLTTYRRSDSSGPLSHHRGDRDAKVVEILLLLDNYHLSIDSFERFV